MKRACILILVCLTTVATVRADVKFGSVFGDHMVLQRGMKLPIWGMADPGEKVTVSLGEQEASAAAAADGRWRVVLPARSASTEALTLTANGRSSAATARDVLVGEVWLCSGQSNMYFPLRSATTGPEAIRQAGAMGDVRILNYVAKPYGGAGKWPEEAFDRLNPQRYMQGRWAPCSPKSVVDCSAVGFFFVRALRAALKVPVGLIHASKGGTPCESWIRRSAIAGHPQLRGMAAGDWYANEMIGAWCRGRARQNLGNWFQRVEVDREAGKAAPYRPRPRHPFEAGCMWDFGIGPLAGFAIRGVLWYQGESNAESARDVALHGKLLPLLIADWRRQWNQGELPFLLVQLPRIDAANRTHWPAFRESQSAAALALPDVHMAVTLDLGDSRRRSNVHPPGKAPVGERLARLARAAVYGQTGVAGVGPRFKSAVVEGVRVRVAFHAGAPALVLRKDTHPGKAGFELAGPDGSFHPGEAKVLADGRTVEVRSESVARPRAVRYGWHMWPTMSLFDKAGLPAEPFRYTFPTGSNEERTDAERPG